MAKRENLETAREYERGDRARAATLNSLMDWVRQQMSDARAHDGLERAGAHAPYCVHAIADDDIPEYSVVGVYISTAESSGSLATPEVACGACGGAGRGSLFGLFTNGPVPVETGLMASLRPINMFDPVILRVSGTTPNIGDPCGIKLGTMLIENTQVGMVCLSSLFDPGGSSDCVWAMLTPEAPHVIGEVISGAEARTGSTMGAGTIGVLFRDALGELVPAVNPNTGSAPWIMGFHNLDQVAVGSGQFVQLGRTLGIGLVHAGAASSSFELIEVWHAEVSSGVLVESVEGYHRGRLRVWDNVARDLVYGDQVWLLFVDRWDADVGDPTIAEQGFVYGPCKLIGTYESSGSSGTLLYATDLWDEEYLARNDDPVDAGVDGIFSLCHLESDTDSGIDRTARALMTMASSGMLCVVRRMKGGGHRVASPLECMT